MTIQIGRMPGRQTCDLCPVALVGGITGIQFDGPSIFMEGNTRGRERKLVNLCPSCLVTLEKLIKEERTRARVEKMTEGERGRV